MAPEIKFIYNMFIVLLNIVLEVFSVLIASQNNCLFLVVGFVCQ